MYVMDPGVIKDITLLKSCPSPFLPLWSEIFLHRQLFSKHAPSCWMQEGAFPSVPLQPGPGHGLLCHYAPTTSVERQPYGLARASPHFSTPISISSLLHAPKFSACKSLWRGLSNFHGAPSEHQVSGLFFFPASLVCIPGDKGWRRA